MRIDPSAAVCCAAGPRGCKCGGRYPIATSSMLITGLVMGPSGTTQ
ncbi:MAG TPA: hypothetical protein VMU03_17020 [Gammaproteobacteria bacterium]|nr:hypothetical protein [Gammaproteobacteria bacterium]